MNLPRRVAIAVPVAALLLTTVPAMTAAVTVPTAEPATTVTGTVAATTDPTVEADVTEVLPEPAQGEDAVEALGEDLAEAADRNDMSARELTSLLREDDAAWVDGTGRVFFVEEPHEAAGEPAPPALAGAPTPMPATDSTFALHSKPGSTKRIYLDFDGQLVKGTEWNRLGVSSTVPQPPFDTDGRPDTFSVAERSAIRTIWELVSEDYAPFDVDVTTQAPGLEALRRSTSSDDVYGTRVLVTSGSEAAGIICGGFCGGVAYMGVFAEVDPDSRYAVAWVFPDGLDRQPKAMAEAASHEAGHNLGLDHDGDASSEYYMGHGPWAPIMGAGYTRPVTQWNRGEYPDGNPEDDIATITRHGLGLRPDDHGSSVGTATGLPPTAEAKATGVITTRGDRDYFSVEQYCPGPLTLHAKPAGRGANLDTRLRLLSADGTELARANPTVARTDSHLVATGLDATITHSVAAGTYYAEVDGVGATGYSDYGSLGAYTLTAQTCASPDNATAPGAPHAVAVSTDVAAGTATLTWSPPAFDGGSAVTEYVVERDGVDASGAEFLPLTLAPGARDFTFEGLVKDEQYTLRVYARNEHGDGTATVRVVTLTEDRVASAPRAVTATPGHRAVRLSWQAPSDLGSHAVEGYRVTVYRAGVALGRATFPAGVRAVGVRDLANGRSYAFAVHAVSAAGNGSTSRVRAVPRTVPSAPRMRRARSGAVGGEVTAKVAWDAPRATGGAAVTGYRVIALRVSTTGRVLSRRTTRRPASARAATVALPRRGTYRFTVRAVNVAGAGKQSARSNAVAGR